MALLLPSGDRLVPRTHDDYAYQARAAAELVALTRDDVYLAALPASSNFAFGCPGILGTLTAGGNRRADRHRGRRRSACRSSRGSG
ncbi:hypothetical protein [Streptomyces showdoensis]|uniref:hypothetical protein n=1 Tax=Streptomyces showdoensis TaxID=68268 RepID=UPI0031EFDDCE